MADEKLLKIIENIYFQIEKRNRLKDYKSIPESTEFFQYLTKTNKLKLESLSDLLEILVKSHKLFLFDIVKEDMDKNIIEVQGLVIANLSTIKTILSYFEKELVRIFSEEFEGHQTIMQILKNFSRAMRNKFNNTPLGKAANIVIELHKFEETLKRDSSYNRNARTFSEEWQNKKFNNLINVCGPVTDFLKGPDDDNKTETVIDQSRNKRRKADTIKNVEKTIVSLQNSIEKNLAVYGVEFFTRICFREYKFSTIKKLLSENHIKKKDELLLLKKILQKVRTHSDQDMNLQKHASDINTIEKMINEKINSSI